MRSRFTRDLLFSAARKQRELCTISTCVRQRPPERFCCPYFWREGASDLHRKATIQPGVTERTFVSTRQKAKGESVTPVDTRLFDGHCAAIEECNDLLNAHSNIPALQSKLEELNKLVEDPKLYEDSARASRVVQERAMVESKLATVERLPTELQNWKEMHAMALSEGEEDLLTECMDKVQSLRREAEHARIETLLASSGELSSSNCFLELIAGAGGKESHDWTEMLSKMYIRWAEDRGFHVQTIAASPGDDVGLRNATYLITGSNAYGWLTTEAGVHRLVRNSPFDPANHRHTSFSQVRLYPETESGGGGIASIEIAAKDVKVDTMRAQGAGGQHVNTTDSAVRLTHIPTGLVTTCQSDRSQHRNKETAMRVLKAKIYQQQEQERLAKRNAYAAGLGDNAFGHQIRSYVMSPYQLIKDHRTNKQENDVAAVLAGNLDGFIQASLIARHMEEAASNPNDQ